MSLMNPEPCKKASLAVQVMDNGYVFHFIDETNWKHEKTVHEGGSAAREQMKKIVDKLFDIIDEAEKGKLP